MAAKKKSRGKAETAKRVATAARVVLPLIPTRDHVALPGQVVPVYITKGASADAVEQALRGDSTLLLSLDSGTNEAAVATSDLSRICSVAKVVHSVNLPNGDMKVRLSIYARAKIVAFVGTTPFVRARAQVLENGSEVRLNKASEAVMKNVKETFVALSQFDPALEDFLFAVQETFDPGSLADIVCGVLPLSAAEGQKVLEQFHPIKRLELAGVYVNAHVDMLATRERAANRAQSELGKLHHQEMLREQIRQMQAELGEETGHEDDVEDLKTQLDKLKMPANAKKEAEKQLRRLRQLHPDTSEAALARTYLDWLMDLPWSSRTKDAIDLTKARAILDADHYGLDKVKERILDFLGVSKLRKQVRGPVLLFVGPPGVGKTTLGKSIAKALGRKFVRASVGGLRDEAELRGHRRTYVGALPGRIIQGLKTANTRNPVFIIDEIDKIGNDFRGDPASVLLEILDPEQNKEFEDHYLNIPFDLSEVMFIATANITDSIPAALFDRMEIIEIPGYTTEEKLEIAKRYLVPREKELNGLSNIVVDFDEPAILYLIDRYTRESGVRDLGRVISTVLRKVARMLAEGKKAPPALTPDLVEELLGPIKFVPDKLQERDEVGIVTGLAWTPVGGEVLTIEASNTPGKGTLSLTGQLGEVMRESAMAALTYVQSNALRFGISPTFYDNAALHVHVPHGAIPKDGPSAGMAIALALVSLLTGRPVSREVAMTGEITLRGNVLAIGGLREKALAALRVGATTVLIPKENARELVEFPSYLKERITFVPVETVDQAVEAALLPAGQEVTKQGPEPVRIEGPTRVPPPRPSKQPEPRR